MLPRIVCLFLAVTASRPSLSETAGLNARPSSRLKFIPIGESHFGSWPPTHNPFASAPATFPGTPAALK